MKRTIAVSLIIVAALVALVLLTSRTPDGTSVPVRTTTNVVEAAVPAAPSMPATQTPAAGTAATTPTPATVLTPEVTAAVQVEMDTVKFHVRDFRLAFGGNPVGNNAEITKALMGANPKKTKFVLLGDSRINAKGELVDRWGMPYFFHQISGTEMEIRSAGPDKVMWNGDDVITR